MKRKILLITTVVALMIGGCAKDGETGPAGPAGPAGTNGNANVIGTNSVNISSWTWNAPFYNATISANGITQDIVDRGMIEVFRSYGADGWTNLPDILGINSTTFTYKVGEVKLWNSNSDFTHPSYPAHATYRFVIISASNRIAHPNTNWKNYSEVKKALNLLD